MSNFYIVSMSGSQQKINVGEEVVVDRVDLEEGKTFEVTDVLLSNMEDKVTIGKPNLSEVKATFEVVRHFRGEKIEVRKFRAKSRYKKKTGHRSDLSSVKLLEVK